MGSVPLTGKVVRVRPTFPFAEKQYARKIERSGFKAVICYGIAFYRKECLVRTGDGSLPCPAFILCKYLVKPHLNLRKSH